MSKVKEINREEAISKENFEQILEERFALYSKYIIQDRALPDIRDGLKPVQRRILYSMYLDNNTYKYATKKSAKAVGLIIGNFHPHGESSVYDALVRLSQSWKMNHPLVEMQGNNGSIDDDPAAAMRYTESRLEKISDLLLLDIDKETVDYIYNFDDTMLEPTVLPSFIPNLLLNGATGIAIGYSTNIPPHNLEEIINAITYRLDNPTCGLSDILEFIKGPDFPTGGIITLTSGLVDAYDTGKGRILVRSKVEIKERELLITEIPYEVTKSALVNDLKLQMSKSEGSTIEDVIDLSDREGLKILISLKEEANPQALLQYLYKSTRLQISYNFNMVSIISKKPVLASLLLMIDSYLKHLNEIVIRRAKFEIKKALKRIHILEGLMLAILNLDEVIALIRESSGKADSKRRLIERYEITDEQAEAIVMLPLHRLSKTDSIALIKEKEGLEADNINNTKLIESSAFRKKHISKELVRLNSPFFVPRKTQISNILIETNVTKDDLILKAEMMVVVTRDGYIKRTNIRSYNQSNSAPGFKSGDIVLGTCKAYTTDKLILFFENGTYGIISIYELEDLKYKAEGQHVSNYLKFSTSVRVVSAVIVAEFKELINIVLLTSDGNIKRTSLKEFFVSKMVKPSICFKLSLNEVVVGAGYSDGDSDILVASNNESHGFIARFNESNIPLTGIKSGGVKTINDTRRHGVVRSLLINNHYKDRKILILTSEGGCRIINDYSIATSKRLLAPSDVYNCFKSSPHNINKILYLTSNDDNKIYALQSDETVLDIDLNTDSFYRDNYMKQNIKIDANHFVFACNNIIDYIGEDTITYEPKVIKKAKVSQEESFDGFVQGTIFDDPFGE